MPISDLGSSLSRRAKVRDIRHFPQEGTVPGGTQPGVQTHIVEAHRIQQRVGPQLLAEVILQQHGTHSIV